MELNPKIVTCLFFYPHWRGICPPFKRLCASELGSSFWFVCSPSAQYMQGCVPAPWGPAQTGAKENNWCKEEDRIELASSFYILFCNPTGHCNTHTCTHTPACACLIPLSFPSCSWRPQGSPHMQTYSRVPQRLHMQCRFYSMINTIKLYITFTHSPC